MANEELILKTLSEIKSYSLLAAKEMLSVEDVASLTGMKVTYIRKLANTGVLPYYKPFGKMLFFKKSEINSLLMDKENRVPSVAEILERANKSNSKRV